MANEQTSVPLYAASEILTAANLNISAGTGTPVFSTTVTRDAAFGGAGEKVLAEGQLCYLSSTNVVQYYDGALWNTLGPTTSKIAQVVNFTSATQTTSTSTSFVTSGIAATITPTLNTSKILIMVSTAVRNGDPARLSGFTLFRGTVAGTNIGEATSGFNTFNAAGGQFYTNLAITYIDSPATTSATTYTLGMKVNNAANTVYAQDSGGWGGTGSTSSMILVEVLA